MRSPAAARFRRRRFLKDTVALREYLRSVSPDETDAERQNREDLKRLRAT